MENPLPKIPGRAEWASSHRPTAMATGILLVAGGALAISSPWLPPSPAPGRGAVFLLAGAGMLAGVFLALGRFGFSLDEKTLTLWKGLGLGARGPGFRLFRKTLPRDRFFHVRLNRRVKNPSRVGTRQRGSSRVVFQVLLEGRGEPVFWRESGSYRAARAWAEALAGALFLPLHDRGSGETRVREPGSLEESLRDRALRTGEGVDLAFSPGRTRARISRDAQGLLLEVPGPGLTFLHKTALAVSACVGAAGFFPGRLSPPPLVLGLAAAGLLLRHAYTGRAMRASREGFSVRATGLFPGRTREIPGPDLEEFFLQKPRIGPEHLKEAPEKHRETLETLLRILAPAKIVARSDARVLSIPLAVPPREAEYLYTLLKAALIR